MIDSKAIAIRPATPADLRYITDRIRMYSNTVGNLRPANVEYLLKVRGTIWLATIDSQPAGAVVCSGGIRKPLCFRANLIERELWERGIGTLLTAFLQALPASQAFGGVRVRTRADIVAQLTINQRAGGSIVDVHPGGRRGWEVQEWWLPACPAATHPGPKLSQAQHQPPAPEEL